MCHGLHLPTRPPGVEHQAKALLPLWGMQTRRLLEAVAPKAGSLRTPGAGWILFTGDWNHPGPGGRAFLFKKGRGETCPTDKGLSGAMKHTVGRGGSGQCEQSAGKLSGRGGAGYLIVHNSQSLSGGRKVEDFTGKVIAEP